MRMPDASRRDYALAVKFLREEFLDDSERTGFENNMDFINAVANSVKKHRLTSLQGAEKDKDNEHEGVKRYIACIRDKKGRKNKDLVKTYRNRSVISIARRNTHDHTLLSNSILCI